MKERHHDDRPPMSPLLAIHESRANPYADGSKRSCAANHIITAALMMAAFGIATVGAEQEFQGVPRVRADYKVDVETWWAGHPMNPDSPKYLAQIPSPELVVTLKSGESIQEAIAFLPRTGGTIRLEPGNYRPFRIYGRSHVHILGPEKGEAVILCGKASCIVFAHVDALDVAYWTVMGTLRPGPGKYAHYYASRMHWEINKNPPRDFYFKNIVFDGEGRNRPCSAVIFRRICDVVVDHCVFRNFGRTDPPEGPPGVFAAGNGENIWPDQPEHESSIFAAGNGENIWLRNCSLDGKKNFFTCMNGVEDSGVVNCTVECRNFGARNFIFMHDYDRISDWNENGKYDRPEQMTPQYIVIQGNTLNGNANAFILCEGFDVLVRNNVCTGRMRYAAEMSPVVPFMHESFAPGAYNVRLVGNKVQGGLSEGVLCCGEWEHDKERVMALPREKICLQRDNDWGANPVTNTVNFVWFNLDKFVPWYHVCRE